MLCLEFSGITLNNFPERNIWIIVNCHHYEMYIFQGRDFESAFVNHKYTREERKTLATYESLDYLPSHSIAYKQWLKRQPPRYIYVHFVYDIVPGVLVAVKTSRNIGQHFLYDFKSKKNTYLVCDLQ